MTRLRLKQTWLFVAAVALQGCDRQGLAPAADEVVKATPAAGTAEPVAKSDPAAKVTVTPTGKAVATPPGPLDTALILREWRKAENRARCAPLAFASVGRGKGTARRANFSGGWAVAYDQSGLRSAYGLAGAGLIDQDSQPAADQRARLARQWPLFRELEQLPVPSFAGYGAEGAENYSADNPDGNGVNSLAYVRVGGQVCTYNVWSRLGRAHLEHLLENLTVVPGA